MRPESQQQTRLVCPWCQDEKAREYRWAQDLRRHIRHCHAQVHNTMPDKTLSTANLFFFARAPQHYQHGAPDLFTPEALYAQAAMREWCRDRTPPFQVWLDGWRAATHTPTPTPYKRPLQTQHSPQHTKKQALETQIKHITFSPHDIKCYTETHSTIHLTKLDQSIIKDPKHFTTITRRMTSISDTFICPQTSWILEKDQLTKQNIITALGIPSHFIVNILKQPTDTFPEPKLTPPPSTQLSPPRSSQSSTPSSTPDHILRSPTPISLASPCYNPESPYMSTTKEVVKPTHISPHPQYIPTPITDTPSQEMSTEHSKTPSSITTDTPVENTFNTTHTTTPTHNTLQEEALSLLKVGSFPLLPPARREWSAVKEESVQFGDTLLWPPKSWTEMTADQRTLHTEFACMTLHKLDTSQALTDRTTLLHRYNFLVLPGCQATKPTALSTAQYHNYILVKQIASNTSTLPISEQQAIIHAFTPTPSTHIHAVAHLPLRITKDSRVKK